jgi:hypothetical protein
MSCPETVSKLLQELRDSLWSYSWAILDCLGPSWGTTSRGRTGGWQAKSSWEFRGFCKAMRGVGYKLTLLVRQGMS